MRALVTLVVVALLAAGGVYVAAGRIPGPHVTIASPVKFVGTSSPLRLHIDTPRDTLSSLTVVFEQGGPATTLFSLADGSTAGALAASGSGVELSREIGTANVPGLHSGAAKLTVTASRRVWHGVRTITTTETRDLQVRLERPRLSAVSTKHYINVGGAEAVIYKVTPADVRSGVLVGEVEYPGYPAAGAKADGVSLSDPSLRIAFFGLRFDQPVTTPIHLFARDEAGNSARADFDYRVFPKPVKASRIEITDAFLNRVVPAIEAGATEMKPTGSLVDRFLAINGELRRKNAATIASMAQQTSPDLLWNGVVFHPFTNSTAESAFADRRTYVYQGREIDHQVHLGFDLASYAMTPIVAANRGKVLYAAELGIYGNCVIIDHGMGVQSLYGHLSSIEVKPGTTVEKGQPIGKSGMTGLAGGDHLHFTMLVNGEMVNPVEWWDSHWVTDRILRKLHEASGS